MAVTSVHNVYESVKAEDIASHKLIKLSDEEKISDEIINSYGEKCTIRIPLGPNPSSVQFFCRMKLRPSTQAERAACLKNYTYTNVFTQYAHIFIITFLQDFLF